MSTRRSLLLLGGPHQVGSPDRSEFRRFEALGFGGQGWVLKSSSDFDPPIKGQVWYFDRFR